MIREVSIFILMLLSLALTNICNALDSCNMCNCTSDKSGTLNISKEKQLTKYLAQHYQLVGKGGRPVIDTSIPTKAGIFFGLNDISLDENERVLTTSMWVILAWQDEYLVWDPAEYGGLSTVRLESHDIWTPDIMLYNTAEPDSRQRNSLVKVSYNGEINWQKHQIFKSSCALNVTEFPFDTQICHLWFGSWTHTIDEIDLNLLHPSGIDLDLLMYQYGASNEWNITHTVARKDLEYSLNSTTVILKYQLHLQRKMVFSSYILTLPCVFLATLTLVVFCLPPERPDRTGLGMSLFSSFLVLLLILVEAAPSSASSVPKLGLYYCFNMVIIMMSIFLSSLVVNIHKTGDNTKRVPYYIRVIFLELIGRIFLVNVRTCTSVKGSCFHKRKRSSRNVPGTEESFNLLCHQLQTESNNLPEAEAVLNEQTLDNDLYTLQNSPGMHNLLVQNMTKVTEVKDLVKGLLEYIIKREKLQLDHELVQNEWHQLAKVVDRLLFVLYLFAITISLIYSFPEPPFVKQLRS